MSFHPLEAFYRAFDPRHSDELHMNMKPATDIIEREDLGVMVAYGELPGVAKDDLDISLIDNTLHVTGMLRKPSEYQQEKASFLLAERRYGSFKRSFTIAHGVQEQDIKAKMEQGVLRLEVPKKGQSGEERAKKITVA